MTATNPSTAWRNGIAVTPHPPVGATVSGLDIDDLPPGAVDFLVEVLADHGVVIFTGQNIDDAGFVRFLARFGTLTFTRGETPVQGHPDLNVVSNEGRTEPPRSSFHTDTSYVRQPPTYTALRAVVLPERGGETLFTNQYRAFDTLPHHLKAALDRRSATHVATGVDLGAGDESSAEHRVFQRHPVSGRTTIYMSTPQRCATVSGMAHADARASMESLYLHCTADHNVYRHAWSPGDVIMWDNRCVLHKADHSGVDGIRTLHRGLVIARPGNGA